MYKVDIQGKKLTPLNKVSYAELNLRERFDIQEWLDSNPDILGEDLLIIGKEVILPSGIRIDLLAVDRDGNIVVIELKRDDSGSGVEWQAIKYASYCSAFTDDEIYRIFNEYLKNKSESEEAKERLSRFIIHENGLGNLNMKQRIILASRSFHSDVASAVLWLNESGLDITCLKLEPFADGEQLFIQPTVIIPLPEAKDYIQRHENKRKEGQIKQMADESLFISEYSNEELTERLQETFNRESPITIRLIELIRLLLSENRTFDRQEIMEHFDNQEAVVGTHGHGAGGMLSNVSQYLTKPANPHLRQIIGFDHEGWAGSPKNNYFIKEEYRDLVRSLIEGL